MKLFNELLGFAVLTGPLWLILVLLPLSLWLAIKLAKRFKRRSAKIAGGVGIFLLGFAVLFGDEIVGRIYFSYLCSTEAGVKVYQTAELSTEYWDANGKPKFFRPNGDLDKRALGDRYSETALTKPYSSFFRINERHQQLLDNSTHEILGEVINFMYWGGWVSWNFSPHRSAIDCPEFHGNIFWNDFYLRFFKPANSLK
jgi:hypothetical protein